MLGCVRMCQTVFTVLDEFMSKKMLGCVRMCPIVFHSVR